MQANYRKALYAANVAYAVVGVLLATAMAMDGKVRFAFAVYAVAGVFGAFGVVMYYVDGLVAGEWLLGQEVEMADGGD